MCSSTTFSLRRVKMWRSTSISLSSLENVVLTLGNNSGFRRLSCGLVGLIHCFRGVYYLYFQVYYKYGCISFFRGVGSPTQIYTASHPRIHRSSYLAN
jgi:hypothetical protein